MDKSAFFNTALPEAEVKVTGGTMRVRGLTRAEILSLRKATDNENMSGDRMLILERKLLAKALVDPEVTEADVKQWQETVASGELDPLIEKVQELSGLKDGSSKSSLHRVRERAGGGVRVLPR